MDVSRGLQRLFLCVAVAFVPLLTIGLQPVVANDFGEDGSELRQIWNRLEDLERRNTELSQQNARLHRMIDPHAVSTFGASATIPTLCRQKRVVCATTGKRPATTVAANAARSVTSAPASVHNNRRLAWSARTLARCSRIGT